MDLEGASLADSVCVYVYVCVVLLMVVGYHLVLDGPHVLRYVVSNIPCENAMCVCMCHCMCVCVCVCMCMHVCLKCVRFKCE